MDLAGFFWYNMVILTLTGMAIITGLVLAIFTCCKARRRDDLARSALPWLKASASVTLVSQIFWLLGAGLLMLYYGFTSSPPSIEPKAAMDLRLAYLRNLVSFFKKPNDELLFSDPIIHPTAIGQVQCFALLLEVIGSALFLATQFEFVFGLQALSETASSLQTDSMYGEKSTSSGIRFLKTKPRVLSIGGFIVLVVLALGLFAAQEVYVSESIDMSADIIKALVLVVYIVLALAAIASLTFTILQSRDFQYGHRELRIGLISLNGLTVIRYVCMVVLTGAYGASHLDGLWKGYYDAVPFIRVIFAHVLYAISVGVAYGIATKNFEGLWASEIYRHYAKA